MAFVRDGKRQLAVHRQKCYRDLRNVERETTAEKLTQANCEHVSLEIEWKEMRAAPGEPRPRESDMVFVHSAQVTVDIKLDTKPGTSKEGPGFEIKALGKQANVESEPQATRVLCRPRSVTIIEPVDNCDRRSKTCALR
jgi:hypothetical protein